MTFISNENSLPLCIYSADGNSEPESAMEVAPFTGKVPMPPGHTEGSVVVVGGAVEGSAIFASPQKLPAASAVPASGGPRPALPATAPSPANAGVAPKMAAIDSVIATQSVPPLNPPSPADASVSNGSIPAVRPPTSASAPAPAPASAASSTPATAAPATAAASSNPAASVISAPAGSEAEHLFTPIVTQPSSAGSASSSSSNNSSSTWVPNARLPSAGSAADSEGERKEKERSKHKKKSKDKDREKERKDPSKKSPSGAAPFTANGSLYHPAPVDPCSPPQASGDVAHISNGLASAASSDANREDVQSPAYSDISDANDQSPILDAEMTELKKDKLTDALAAPAVAPSALGAYGMYPFYSQAPFMVPPTPASGAMDAKVKEERRESSGGVAAGAGGGGGGNGGGGASGAPGAPPAGAEAPKPVVTDPFKALPANPHMQYPPFGFIPPYPAYPIDPLMVDPNGMRVSGNKTPEGTVHSPRLRVDMSPGRTKPASLDDPATKDQSGSMASGNSKVSIRIGIRIRMLASR